MVIAKQSDPRQETDGSVPDFLLPLQAEYRERLAGQTVEFADWWSRARGGDSEAREALRVAVHRISGNGGTLGYPRLSALAREAEKAIKRGPLPDEASVAIAALIAAMEHVAAQ